MLFVVSLLIVVRSDICWNLGSVGSKYCEKVLILFINWSLRNSFAVIGVILAGFLGFFLKDAEVSKQ